MFPLGVDSRIVHDEQTVVFTIEHFVIAPQLNSFNKIFIQLVLVEFNGVTDSDINSSFYHPNGRFLERMRGSGASIEEDGRKRSIYCGGRKDGFSIMDWQ